MKSLFIYDSNFGNTNIISEPHPFYVKGNEVPLFEDEVEKATDWVKTLIDKCNN